jgi:hypothetical protein
MNFEWLDTHTVALLVAAGLLLWAGRRVLRQRGTPPREGSGLAPHLLGSPIPDKPALPAPVRLALQRRTPPTLPAAMLSITPQPDTPAASTSGAKQAAGTPHQPEGRSLQQTSAAAAARTG